MCRFHLKTCEGQRTSTLSSAASSGTLVGPEDGVLAVMSTVLVAYANQDFVNRQLRSMYQQ